MVTMGEVAFSHLNGQETLDRLAEIQEVDAVAFPSSELTDHRRRTSRQARTPGFGTVVAQVSGRLAGFVYGLPLNADSGWWDGMRPVPSADFVTETGERTFAVIDLAVLPDQRGRGLGRTLLDRLLRSRTEERATLATDPGNSAVQAMYESLRHGDGIPYVRGESGDERRPLLGGLPTIDGARRSDPYDAPPVRSQILLGSLFGVLSGLALIPFGIDVLMWVVWFNEFKDQIF